MGLFRQRDDRGKQVRVHANPIDLLEADSDASTFAAGVVGACFALALGYAIFTVREFSHSLGTGHVMVSDSLPFIVLLPVLVGVVLYGNARLAANETRKQLIDTRRRRSECGACAYSLREARPQPDGCRICPECGAAWRISHPADAGPASV